MACRSKLSAVRSTAAPRAAARERWQAASSPVPPAVDGWREVSGVISPPWSPPYARVQASTVDDRLSGDPSDWRAHGTGLVEVLW
mmetsp:Transcript_12252/g.36194  ORF Transcript_12252/g.36194 Transcript_12252/m.36194 type:complete len:85 (-) Transcript_12252:314-568(-)